MDSAWGVVMPVLWLVAALLYGVIFMTICFIVPPHPKATGRSLLLDFGGCLLAALPTMLILGMGTEKGQSSLLTVSADNG
jgi:hypothetical protein